MSITYDYDELVSALQGYAEENDTEFANNIDDFIGKSETRILRDLDLELFEDWVLVTISAGDRNVVKPNDVIEVNSLFARDPSTQSWFELPRRSFEYCTLYAPVESIQDVPEFYAEFDESDIYVVPTPVKSYSGGNARVRATIRPTGLSATNTTTWLSTNVADLLFAGCMIEVQDYLKNQAAMEKAANKYMSLMTGLENEMQDVKRPKYKAINTQKQGADD